MVSMWVTFLERGIAHDAVRLLQNACSLDDLNNTLLAEHLRIQHCRSQNGICGEITQSEWDQFGLGFQ